MEAHKRKLRGYALNMFRLRSVGLSDLFLDDMWCGEVPLKEAFPLSYRIVRKKDALVAEHLCVQMGLFIGTLFY